jgi:hypothetical protein
LGAIGLDTKTKARELVNTCDKALTWFRGNFKSAKEKALLDPVPGGPMDGRENPDLNDMLMTLRNTAFAIADMDPNTSKESILADWEENDKQYREKQQNIMKKAENTAGTMVANLIEQHLVAVNFALTDLSKLIEK